MNGSNGKEIERNMHMRYTWNGVDIEINKMKCFYI